jgi:hypothetical protein
MMIRTFDPTSLAHLEEYIEHPLLYTHGHQFKGIAAIFLAIVAKETGNQAELPAHARQSGSRD